MKLKYDNPPAIDVPYDLMQDLWWYAAHHCKSRQQAAGAGATNGDLFLTQNGTPYGDTALTDIFADLERRVGFRVRPHMLRRNQDKPEHSAGSDPCCVQNILLNRIRKYPSTSDHQCGK